jgi:hypothetical protein
LVILAAYSFDKKYRFMSKSNQQQMFGAIQQWQQSGLSQKVWCEQNNILYSSFHYWYRRFRNLQSGNKQPSTDGFVELFLQDRSSASPWCELALGKGQRISFHQPVSAAFIKSLLD